MNSDIVRVLAPQVLGILVRRGNDFATAEDAVQEALLQAHRTWGETPPDDPKGWLLTVAGRKLIDARRSEAARRRREEALDHEPEPGRAEQADDTLLLLFLCCHPELSPASAIALTLRAVGGLTTKQIADAFLVPESTMAQRISRAKRTVGQQSLRQPGDVAVVLRVLYLIFNEGFSGSVDLAAEAIRLTRQLLLACDEPEVAGLLALMLLHHARRFARTDADGVLVPLDQQDRTLWNETEIAEGVRILQSALAHDRHGEYQIQAAIAALHDDARTPAETDWPQILQWYDALLAIADNPLAGLSRAIAVGEVDGPQAGLKAVAELESRLGDHHRLDAVRAWLHERAGNLDAAVEHYRRAAERARDTAERDHLVKQADRLNRSIA
ncbi:RNA polymerase sigma factor [Stackebrandtia nassauensis]|uniref:Putative RNA polymerase, sigma-24 subunit, ECF subfamily n=1 Tax=Stackebrandtia nassauensis (strain DSM 44728 / CIP 108903 / NRRL B-16338 / NBRC 102104 / LLR-40K-21) TaxID=446470 RepID=D3PU24_STANL|nr:sigma-70 family RNA polymerase sigma factor [Stackebrandtia nassauensis]ADD40970.1 putative RNA polymerase, sigma-24 subunit, ECF subfamily [Stackebrandtia nassauensis DSM 44728]